MSITVNSARQYPLVAKVTVAYTDIADYATAAAAETFNIVELPAGATVIGVAWDLVTAFADDASETQLIDLGHTVSGAIVADPDAFTATEIDADGSLVSGAAAATEAGMYLEFTVPNAVTFTFTPSAGAAALTAGEIDIWVTYVVNGRDQENQG